MGQYHEDSLDVNTCGPILPKSPPFCHVQLGRPRLVNMHLITWMKPVFAIPLQTHPLHAFTTLRGIYFLVFDLFLEGAILVTDIIEGAILNTDIISCSASLVTSVCVCWCKPKKLPNGKKMLFSQHQKSQALPCCSNHFDLHQAASLRQHPR